MKIEDLKIAYEKCNNTGLIKEAVFSRIYSIFSGTKTGL